MSARPKTNNRFNGREYADADEMPSDVRAAYDRARDDMALLHSGARLAAKLNAKIIVNGNEFSNAGEMSVDDRHLYHEALGGVIYAGYCGIHPNQRREHSPIMRAVRNVYRKPRDFFA